MQQKNIMPNYIYILFCCFILACQADKNHQNTVEKIDIIAEINMPDSLLATKFKAQIKTCAINLLATINDDFSYEKLNIPPLKDSVLGLNISSFIFHNKGSYTSRSAHFKIYQSQQQPHLWIDIDFFDNSFWRSSNFGNKDTAAVLWTFKSIVKNLFIKLPYPCDKTNDEAEKCDINSQMFVEAKNKKGQIIDISEYGQFEEVNQFLAENIAYHGRENIAKINSLISTLQQQPQAKQYNQMARYQYAQIPNNTAIFEPILYDFLPKNCQKNCPDSARLKVRGVDFYKGQLYYLTAFITRDTLERKILNTYYIGYESEKDDISLLKTYLQSEPPTFLYYKYAGTNAMPWYNYFVAYHVDYIKNVPKITKVRLICPRRIYRYWCYPSGFCDDVAADIIRTQAYMLK